MEAVSLLEQHDTPPKGPQGPMVVFLNPASGAGNQQATVQRVKALFREAGRDVQIVSELRGEDVAAAVERALHTNPSAIIAGGGDGTVRTVAAALRNNDVPMGVLPLGTLNHFARDLRIPLALEDAVRVIHAGHTTRVDMAEVNGSLFLNNSSLGLYARMVQLREQHPIRGPGKWLIAAWALLRELRKNRTVNVTVLVDAKAVTRRTPLLMVGNNQYKLTGFEATSRESLRDGLLAVYIVKPGGRGRIVKLVWQILIGRAKHGDHVEMLRSDRVTIEVKRSPLPVAFDGEVALLDAPLEYRVLPAALTVLVPPPSA